MYSCSLCPAQTKTRQGLAGHYRFRHDGIGYVSNDRPGRTDLRESLTEMGRRLEDLEHELKMVKNLVVAIGSKMGALDQELVGFVTQQDFARKQARRELRNPEQASANPSRGGPSSHQKATEEPSSR